MNTAGNTREVVKQGAADSGEYFRHMAEFIGFSETDARIVRQTKPIVDKNLADIVAKFYDRLLRYPATRTFFLKKDGTLDQEYVELRMRHQTNFWLRTAEAVFDDDYARYIDYVGRAHTARGADPNIYVAERYVIGMVSMVQRSVGEALSDALQSSDPELALRATRSWDKLMMLILVMLSRAYGGDIQPLSADAVQAVDFALITRLAESAFAREAGRDADLPTKSVAVAEESDIPEGERRIVQVEGLTIGVFHHHDAWYALRSSCVHRGGPVCTGDLDGDVLTCPWHGFQYNITDGRCLADPSARLDTYRVTIEDGKVYLHIPDLSARLGVASDGAMSEPGKVQAEQRTGEFRAGSIQPGQMRKVRLNGADVAVFNVGGTFYATQDACTHAGASLSEGELSGSWVTCPLHGSQFDVITGRVLEGPADEPLRLYTVRVDGDTGVVEPAA